jgi:hypothetical protein
LKGQRAELSLMDIWVDGAYCEADLYSVAHSILRRHLLDLARTAKGDALPSQAVDAVLKRAMRRRESSTSERRKQARRTHFVQPDKSQYEVIGEPRIVRYILEGSEPTPCEDLAAWKQHMVGSSEG